MDSKTIKEKVETARIAMEQALGVPVRVNIRHDLRTGPLDEAEVHKTQVELEAYVPGPGLMREQTEKARASTAATQEA